MSGTKEESDDKFLIWPQLKGDKHFVYSLPLSDVYLNNDSTWPWVVLVPRKNDTVEYHELSNEEQMQLMREMSLISRLLLKGWPTIAKLNTGMIGCVCRQLHCHILGRFENDKCWPNPVWGASEAAKYSEEEAKETREKLERLIKEEEEELLLLKSSTN
jgi:diadenosine tetraphosphate (Ap4A) HIT family hydrolase